MKNQGQQIKVWRKGQTITYDGKLHFKIIGIDRLGAYFYRCEVVASNCVDYPIGRVSLITKSGGSRYREVS